MGDKAVVGCKEVATRWVDGWFKPPDGPGFPMPTKVHDYECRYEDGSVKKYENMTWLHFQISRLWDTMFS